MWVRAKTLIPLLGHAPHARLFLLVLLLLVVAAQAQDFTYITNNGTITITGSHVLPENVIIPDTIDGLPVTSIGAYAFSYDGSLTNVILGEGVTNIGAGAFFDCLKLVSFSAPSSNRAYSTVDGVLFDKSQTTLVLYPEAKAGNYTIPETVTNIPGYAFKYCLSLTNVSIPSSVTSIESGAFEECGLTSLSLPSSITEIGSETFDECFNLTNVIIPNSVTNIGDDAFGGCPLLSNVTIGSNVTSIGFNAFLECTSLTNLTIPDSVKTIGSRAFGGCTSLTNFVVGPLNSTYSSVGGVLFDKSQATLIQFPTGKAGSYTIPSGVTNIAVWAFLGCPGLTNVTVPNTVSQIGYGAFEFCLQLTGVYFQGNAPGLASSVFGAFQQPPDPAIIYYLPGAVGWDTMFGGLPTQFWQPQVQSGDASFGVRGNQFGFNINWASGMTVVVEATTNLTNPAWHSELTNVFTSNSFYFSDPQWTNYPNRFYRIRSP
jgi:hypothetical protein